MRHSFRALLRDSCCGSDAAPWGPTADGVGLCERRQGPWLSGVGVRVVGGGASALSCCPQCNLTYGPAQPAHPPRSQRPSPPAPVHIAADLPAFIDGLFPGTLPPLPCWHKGTNSLLSAADEQLSDVLLRALALP